MKNSCSLRRLIREDRGGGAVTNVNFLKLLFTVTKSDCVKVDYAMEVRKRFRTKEGRGNGERKKFCNSVSFFIYLLRLFLVIFSLCFFYPYCAVLTFLLVINLNTSKRKMLI